MPSDLVSKGFAEVVIQDIVIKTNNIKYLREIFYSPSENKYYRAQLPEGVRGQGEFGIGIRSLIPMLKMMGVTEKPMVGFFENIGIVVSPTYVSQQWTGGYDWAHQEKASFIAAAFSTVIMDRLMIPVRESMVITTIVRWSATTCLPLISPLKTKTVYRFWTC
ncbi:MAG: hypothetical protein Q9M50_02965 [Methylococcales bacterium]|nr:hypothetical protein [Methylococcales bacterium]